MAANADQEAGKAAGDAPLTPLLKAPPEVPPEAPPKAPSEAPPPPLPALSPRPCRGFSIVALPAEV